jgi:tetratricopeptide (TPR) repeat protein
MLASGLVYVYSRISNHRFARAAVWTFVAILLIATQARSRSFEGRYLINSANFTQYPQNDPKAAIPLYLRAESDYGIRTGSLYAGLTNAYGLMGEWENALRALRKVGTVDPEYALNSVVDRLDPLTQDTLIVTVLAPLLENETWRARAAEKAAPFELFQSSRTLHHLPGGGRQHPGIPGNGESVFCPRGQRKGPPVSGSLPLDRSVSK